VRDNVYEEPLVQTQTPNKRIDTDAQTAAFVRCLGAGHAQRWPD
jgi:hypothetical protein